MRPLVYTVNFGSHLMTEDRDYGRRAVTVPEAARLAAIDDADVRYGTTAMQCYSKTCG